MNKKIFGFDLGIASIGWAVINLDDDVIDLNYDVIDKTTGEVLETVDTSGKIIDAGVRIFTIAENRKTGESLAAPRRKARLSRRTTARKAKRKLSIRNLLVEHKLVSENDINKIFVNQHKYGGDVWSLRVKGLTEKLTKLELARVLFHLAKHRGFKSVRKAEEEKDKEAGKVLTAIKNNKEASAEGKTIAQFLYEKTIKNDKPIQIRNRQVPKIDKSDMIKVKTSGEMEYENSYINSIPRTDIERELGLIFEKEKKFGIFTDELLAEFKKIAFMQRDIQGVGKMVGKCTLETNEKRAPKEAITSELFVAMSKINNLKPRADGVERFLTDDERKSILELLKKNKDVKYTSIKNALKLDPDTSFNSVNYNIKPKKETSVAKIKNPEDTSFYKLSGYHKLKGTLKDNFEKYDIKDLDKIVTVIATEKTDEKIRNGLTATNIKFLDNDLDKLLTLSFSKFIHLSLKALYKINPHMELGLTFDKACEQQGYDHRSTGESFAKAKGDHLKPIDDDLKTTSPVVNRTVTQFRKLYNAIVDEYGAPDQIVIETGRELKKTHDERQKIQTMQDKNRQEHESAKEQGQLISGFTGSKKHVLMKRLYEHQGGKCIYSGKPISIDKLYKVGEYEVDHILPYSRSLDDGFNNKALCLRSENQEKGNMTPFEYFGHDAERWADFTARVNSTHMFSKIKKDRLCSKDFKKNEEGFRERNGNDNSWISGHVGKYLEDSIDFSKSKADINEHKRIQRRAGGVTAYLRSQWGLKKDRAAGDLHHAQDAIVIAVSTEKMVHKISYISSQFKNKAKYQQYGKAWFEAMKKHIQNPWDNFRNEVEDKLNSIDGTSRVVSRSQRKKVTGELHGATIRTKNEHKKTFKAEYLKSGIEIRGGVASKGEMPRVDVFSKRNKAGKEEFYLVPIYVIDIAKGVIPNKAIVAGKEEKDWVTIDDTFTFKFSLYKDTLIRTQKKDDVKFGYFTSAHRGTANLNMTTHDSSKKFEGVGVKTVDSFQKFYVDYLGNYYEVKNEKRELINKSKKKIKASSKYVLENIAYQQSCKVVS